MKATLLIPLLVFAGSTALAQRPPPSPAERAYLASRLAGDVYSTFQGSGPPIQTLLPRANAALRAMGSTETFREPQILRVLVDLARINERIRRNVAQLCVPPNQTDPLVREKLLEFVRCVNVQTNSPDTLIELAAEQAEREMRRVYQELAAAVGRGNEAEVNEAARRAETTLVLPQRIPLATILVGMRRDRVQVGRDMRVCMDTGFARMAEMIERGVSPVGEWTTLFACFERAARAATQPPAVLSRDVLKNWSSVRSAQIVNPVLPTPVKKAPPKTSADALPSITQADRKGVLGLLSTFIAAVKNRARGNAYRALGQVNLRLSTLRFQAADRLALSVVDDAFRNPSLLFASEAQPCVLVMTGRTHAENVRDAVRCVAARAKVPSTRNWD